MWGLDVGLKLDATVGRGVGCGGGSCCNRSVPRTVIIGPLLLPHFKIGPLVGVPHYGVPLPPRLHEALHVVIRLLVPTEAVQRARPRHPCVAVIVRRVEAHRGVPQTLVEALETEVAASALGGGVVRWWSEG